MSINGLTRRTEETDPFCLTASGAARLLAGRGATTRDTLDVPAGARGASMTETVAAGTAVRTSGRAWWGSAAALVAAAWSANQFAPLIVLYQTDPGLSGSELDAMYAVYVIGLVPALLVGGRLSDAIGRRRVVLPAMVLCLVGTLALMAGGAEPAWLYPGRLVTGLGCGLAYVAATAWLKELRLRPAIPVPARNARRWP